MLDGNIKKKKKKNAVYLKYSKMHLSRQYLEHLRVYSILFRSIKSELEDYTKLKAEHDLAVQNLAAARSMIQQLEESLSNSTERRSAVTDEQKQLIQQQLSSVKEAAKSLSTEVDTFRGATAEQFASCSQVLKDWESTFEQWKAR